MTQDNQRTAKQITSGKYQRLMALSDEQGRQNIEALNAVLGQGVQPWWNP